MRYDIRVSPDPIVPFLEQASYMVMAKRNADNRPGRTIMLHRIIVINKSGIHHATHLEDRAKVRIVHGQAEITIQGTFLFQRYSEILSAISQFSNVRYTFPIPLKEMVRFFLLYSFPYHPVSRTTTMPYNDNWRPRP